MALRWLIENPAVLAIPGAKNTKQAMDDAGALTFSLTAEEVRGSQPVDVGVEKVNFCHG